MKSNGNRQGGNAHEQRSHHPHRYPIHSKPQRAAATADSKRDDRRQRAEPQHGIRQKRDDVGIGKTLTAFVRRADEGTLSRLTVEASIVLAASRGNPATVVKAAASAYKVDTDAIAAKVKQEFAAKEKAKKVPPPAAKTAKKAA